MTETIKREIKTTTADLSKELTIVREIKVGDHVRCWDFVPRPNAPDCYVEGIVTEIEGELINVHVLKDTVHGPGARLSIKTPIETFFSEFSERITKLGYHNESCEYVSCEV